MDGRKLLLILHLRENNPKNPVTKIFLFRITGEHTSKTIFQNNLKQSIMKKQLVILILSLFSLSAFSNSVDSEDAKVNKVVLTKFEKSFPNAKDVNWEKAGPFIKARFELNGYYMVIYFNSVGDQVAVTRNLSAIQLPLPAYISLKEKLADGKWLTELFELAKDDSTTYYASIEDAEYTYVMKAENGGDWKLYKKTKKELN